MPVGMTLQQLYSQPTFESNVNATATTNATAVPTAASKRPPPLDKDYSPRAFVPMPTSYPPPTYGQQLPPPHAYAQYHPKNQGDDYTLADPLPFEYMGMRKFPDATKDQTTADQRYAPYQGSYSTQSPHPAVYESQHAHPPKSVEDRAYHQQYVHHVNDRTAQAYGGDVHAHFAHHATPQQSMPSHLYPSPVPSSAMNVMSHTMHHSFPPLVETQNLKKETAVSDAQQYGSVNYAPAPTTQSGASQEAVIKVKTPLKTKYWRNGRRNLQCFPSCKVFGDYSSIKIEDLKQHDFMWGKCRGSLITEVTLNSSVSFDDILILGRVHSLENVPVAFEEAVIRECMLGRMVEPEVMDSMKDQWITGERLPDFVQQEGNTACYEFKPKVWKYTEDMTQGKCKRRNVKYYVQFEAFVLVMSGERRYYACIGSGMSTAFEVGSSRVLARQKRKAATGLDANPLYLKPGQSVGSPTDMSANGMGHPMMQQHPMMVPPHPMHSQMYAPSYAPAGYPAVRGMAPGMPPHPSMHHPSMMNQMGHPESMQYHQPAPPQQQQPASMLPSSSSSSGQKRKASSPVDERAKAKKNKDTSPTA